MYIAIAFLISTGCARGMNYYGTHITGYNHSQHDIAYFSAKIGDGKSGGEGYIGAGTGGGSMTCCIQVPIKWEANLRATVRFTADVNGADKEIIKEVSIPKYSSDDAGHVSVHFLYDGSVKVFFTQYSLGHRKHPLIGKESEMKPGVPTEIIWQ